MVYDLNQIDDPKRFQRLLNAILIARFGEDARITPLRGADGASDGETAADNPHMQYEYTGSHASETSPLFSPPRPGRYLFQAKYHRTGEQRLADLRTLVVREFEDELNNAVLRRADRSNVNYFFLVTNIPSSRSAIEKVEAIRSSIEVRRNRRLHTDIWWSEHVTGFLDWAPDLWFSFPEIFPGGKPPMLVQATKRHEQDGSPRTFRLAISNQYSRDLTVKFRQIELERKLFDLFVEIDINLPRDTDDSLLTLTRRLRSPRSRQAVITSFLPFDSGRSYDSIPTALELLINDELSIARVLLEGGPGQGKSTITQMAAQIYRKKVLDLSHTSRNPTWDHISKLRLPIRIELRRFAEWLSGRDGTIEQFIASMISKDSGGASFDVRDLHALVEKSSVILVLDGLDEVGSDLLRDRVIDLIMDTIRRFEADLKVDLRVVLTTRPPALAGRRDKLDGFTRLVLAPMTPTRIDDYLDRWLAVQVSASEDHDRIRKSFNARRDDPHVGALARNPMQLSVLLQLINLKGDAFPDRRAELYGDYFKIVIDRDVEKSPELRENRDLVEGLHSFLGFNLHGSSEIDQRSRTLGRTTIIDLARSWLQAEGHPSDVADRCFALGEERFGLIVAISGEGQNTTYGFEVQPIQEYFAASYISNRLPSGKAHDIFGLLIHRGYWREVALFLAGLRRPNEKADLVTRAKEADRDQSLGWQQNGRSIVLQLLREGVLHEPPHVKNEAIEFVVNVLVDLLDMGSFRVRRVPDSFVETICEIGEQFPNDLLRDRVLELAAGHSQSDDWYAIVRVFRIAASVLTDDQYMELVNDYSETGPSIKSFIFMAIPYAFRGDDIVRRLTEQRGYWCGVPMPMWAQEVWRAVLHIRHVAEFRSPPGMHSSLVAEFATDYPFGMNDGGRPIDIKDPRPLAIWKLLQNTQLIHRDIRPGGGGRSEIEASVRPSYQDVDYAELSGDVLCCVRDLIQTSDLVLQSAGHGQGDVGDSLGPYLASINEHMKDQGIAGWVAVRCAMGLLYLRDDLMDDLLSVLREFFSTEDVTSVRRAQFGWRYAVMPVAIRPAHGAVPIPLQEIVAKVVTSGQDMTFQWLKYAPFSMMVVRPLLADCGSNIVELLRFIGERRLVGFNDRKLRVQDTQRILKVCRMTGDPEVLRGAATLLTRASYARIAEPNLMAKILSAAPDSQLSAQVFSASGDYYDDETSTNYREIFTAFAGKVVEEVLVDPRKFSSEIVIRAATFKAENFASTSKPLFEEFRNLVRPES